MTLGLDITAAPASPLRRLDPRWKLGAIGGAVVGVALLQQPLPALAALAGGVGLALLARLPAGWYLGRLGVALAFPAFFAVWLPFVAQPGHDVGAVGGVTVSLTGVRHAVALLAKAACVVSLVLVLLATAPAQSTFQAAHSLHAPGWLVQLLLMSYRYVFLLAEEFGRLRTALRVRGYRNRANLHSYRTIGQVAGTLLVRGHERSERIAQAMRCRGFDGRFRSLQAFRTAPADVLFAAVVLASAGGLLAWDGWSRW